MRSPCLLALDVFAFCFLISWFALISSALLFQTVDLIFGIIKSYSCHVSHRLQNLGR